ncbi:MAG: MBL fold metallo-hydrolase [Actinobacteria bacterium]|nr:MBL fold metallo-hydrolase [Actinomycetota bacterium]
MLVAGFPSPVTDTNCYVVASRPGEQCVIVDPGIDIGGELGQVIEEHRLHPIAVLATHGHYDHTFSVFPVCQAHDVPAYIHPADRTQLTDPWSGLGRPYGSPLPGLANLTLAEPDDVRELADGAVLELAGLHFGVRHAPGHTPGSVTFDLDELLFSGDVLFAGSIGRTDLPGGSMTRMRESLQRVILRLDDEITVLPGHGPATTVGAERATNPYLRDL